MINVVEIVISGDFSVLLNLSYAEKMYLSIVNRKKKVTKV